MHNNVWVEIIVKLAIVNFPNVAIQNTEEPGSRLATKTSGTNSDKIHAKIQISYIIFSGATVLILCKLLKSA